MLLNPVQDFCQSNFSYFQFAKVILVVLMLLLTIHMNVSQYFIYLLVLFLFTFFKIKYLMTWPGTFMTERVKAGFYLWFIS